MKKIIVIIGIMFLLSGCGVQQTQSPQQQMKPDVSQNLTHSSPTGPHEPAIDNECTSSEEIENLKNTRDFHNKQTVTNSKYSSATNGIISIDLGKHGFKVIGNERIEFGPWIISGGPCVFEMNPLYNLTFVGTRSKDEIIKDVKRNENGSKNEHNGLKFREVKRINDFDVVVWEEWGGYPTYQLFFEIPGKLKNIYIKTDSLQSVEKDYQNIINILKTLKIEK